MNLLTETPSLPGSVGHEGGNSPAAVLEVPVEIFRLCAECLDDRRFVARFALANGLLFACTACGDERVVPFSRVNSEVA